MASALNKRQQARNERTLQELIKTVPGNGTCADCGARNPGWASWSLGIFLCLRCAALHRKLGTHLSKVKSLSMDKWDNAQVDNMKRLGNTESNKTYNPRNVKPQIPIDIDEVESAMERFIRQKYEHRTLMNDSQPGTRQNTGSTSSDDRPPPLPPKPTRRFGFGLQKNNTFPRSATPPQSPGLGAYSGHDTSPPRVNKPSRVFGSHVNTSGDGLDSKLATLRDMGFADEKRNLTVLKGLNGNLDKSVEALIRLGEQNPVKSRGSTPTPPIKSGVNGISIERTNTAPAAPVSTNPFEALDTVAPLPQQQHYAAPVHTQQSSYGVASAHQSSQSNSYNPFLSQTQQGSYQQQAYPEQQQAIAQQQNPFGQHQQQGLEQSFQGLQLSTQQPPQQLFPNRTGGYGQPQTPQYPQTNPFLQSFTPPPMPQMPQQYSSFYQQPQPQYQSISSPTSPGNPFLKSTRSQMFTSANSMNSNPFGQAQAQTQQQPQVQAQVQPQVPQYQHQQYQQAPNPFMAQQQQHQQQQQQPIQNQAPPAQASNPWQSQQSSYQQQSYQQPQYQQTPSGFDKNSILALYNYPQLAPQHTEQTQTPSAPVQAPAAASTIPAIGHMNPFAQNQGSQPVQQLSAPQPGGVAAQAPGVRHVSNESVDFAGLVGGRHSPDAFSGLSASFRR
ncbi:hypothetical protein BDV95DRAFT_590448 [Massariosphaeria phaeospora]|uniref:Arf-GAP domain-containing protein n=1 Tax=Massariosphaeria phaeospora TaxID=100035 RepID=A0A7C8ICR7_9PLEO|nr:hypothetical protein BDV95DRAFT_590448 [Massariosphaeria phaeospora]